MVEAMTLCPNNTWLGCDNVLRPLFPGIMLEPESESHIVPGIEVEVSQGLVKCMSQHLSQI